MGALKKQERADLVHRRLAELYPDPPIPLRHQDPFTLLVAVVLSAQCTDKKVNEITPALFQAAPTPAKMQRLGEDRILDLIRPLGLSKQKAKSLAGTVQVNELRTVKRLDKSQMFTANSVNSRASSGFCHQGRPLHRPRPPKIAAVSF